MLVKCLYCDVENDALATSGYCESCVDVVLRYAANNLWKD